MLIVIDEPKETEELLAVTEPAAEQELSVPEE